MRRTKIALTAEDRQRLERIVSALTTPQKHVWRARIVLLSAAGMGTMAITRQTGKSKRAVWRWQDRFVAEGVAGLLRDKTRPGRLPPLSPDQVRTVVDKTLREPPAEATHWSTRTMARAVGLDLNPPEHALVLAVDEKSQIQALERTQTPRGLVSGHPVTRTHDYIRHGTTTLFAALDVKSGRVIGRCMMRHRHQEFLRFLAIIDHHTPAHRDLDLIADNYQTHKHPQVRRWLARHPRFHMHFTPTSASWLNLVERLFAELTNKRLHRGIFRSIADLQAAIKRYLRERNRAPKPFVWTKSADTILQKYQRAQGNLSSRAEH
jgi:transposase